MTREEERTGLVRDKFVLEQKLTEGPYRGDPAKIATQLAFEMRRRRRPVGLVPG